MSNYAVSTMALDTVTSSGGNYTYTTAPGSIFRTNPSGSTPSGTKVGVVKSHYTHSFMNSTNPVVFNGGGTKYYTQAQGNNGWQWPVAPQPNPPKRRPSRPQLVKFGSCYLRIKQADVFLRLAGIVPLPYDISGKNYAQVRTADRNDALNLTILSKDSNGDKIYSLGLSLTCELIQKTSEVCQDIWEVEAQLDQLESDMRLHSARIRKLFATGDEDDDYYVHSGGKPPYNTSDSKGITVKGKYHWSEFGKNEITWTTSGSELVVYLFNGAKWGPGSSDVQPAYETADTSNYILSFYSTRPVPSKSGRGNNRHDVAYMGGRTGAADADTYRGGTTSKTIRGDGVASAMREGNYNSFNNSFAPSAVTGERYPALVTGNFQPSAGDYSSYFNLPGTGYGGRTKK